MYLHFPLPIPYCLHYCISMMYPEVKVSVPSVLFLIISFEINFGTSLQISKNIIFCDFDSDYNECIDQVEKSKDINNNVYFLLTYDASLN